MEKKNGSSYYDHRLTQIEKGKLISSLNRLSNSVAENEESPISVGKDTKLLSILQVNPQEIVEAEARMREILDKMKVERGYSDDNSYQGSLAFNGAAPSSNAYFDNREERRKLLPIVWVVKPI